MEKKEEIENVPRCTICAHPDREGIELLGMQSCASWSVCARRINNTFGTHFTPTTVKNHMTGHMLHESAMEAGVILDGLTKEDKPRISVDSMLQTLLIQGMLDLAKGKIRCKTPQELLAVAQTMMNVQKQKDARLILEEGDVQGWWAAMAAYGEAIKATVSPAQLGQIVAKANSLGAGFDIGNVPVETPITVNNISDELQTAVEDYKNGGPRTRKELVDAGVIDQALSQLDIPE